jgi:hypothetical protein
MFNKQENIFHQDQFISKEGQDEHYGTSLHTQSIKACTVSINQ